MARLGKRERQALKELKRIEEARKLHAATILGDSSGYRSAWDNMSPKGKPSNNWAWNWKTDRRINHGGKWSD